MTDHRLAVFVEGQTESIFVKKMVQEIAGPNRVVVREVRANSICTLDIQEPQNSSEKFFVLISDCRQDVTVKSRILENRESLMKANFDLILGLRDLYPHTRAELPMVSLHLTTGVPTKGIPIEICLSIMEIESWFLFDDRHYPAIDPTLTNATIVAETGFNPETDNPEDVDQPAGLLKDIYKIAGKSYRKKRNQVQRTVDVLDYAYLYIDGREVLSSSRRLLDKLDEFF